MKDAIKEKIEIKLLEAMKCFDDVEALIYKEDYDVNCFDKEMELLSVFKSGVKKMLNNHFDRLARHNFNVNKKGGKNEKRNSNIS